MPSSPIAALRLAVALSLVMAVSVSCGDDSTGVDDGDGDGTVVSVVITPTDVTLESLGETLQLSVSGLDADGNEVSGLTFTWESSNTGVAQVSSTGQVEAVTNGSATVTATTGDVSGDCDVIVSQVSASLGFTVQPSSTTMGTTLPEAVEVSFWDARNNLVSNESGSVSLAIEINPNNGTLSGTTTHDPVGGVATFPGLSIDSLGIGYTLEATSGSLSGESMPFHISLPAVWVGLTDDDTLAANDSVTAIDLATNTPVAGMFADGQEPYRMEVSRNGAYAFLIYWLGGVTIIETPTYTPVATIPVTAPTAVAPLEAIAYVATCGAGIQVVSAATRSVVASIPIGDCLNSADLSPDGAFLYTGGYGSGIRVVSTATNTEVDNIGVNGRGLWDLKISPDGDFAYTIIEQDTIRKVDLSSKTVVAEAVVAGKEPWEIEVTPDGSTIYTANGAENSVSVISTSSMTVITTIPVGDYPWELDITPDGAYVYVSNTTDGNVLVIDTSSNTVVQTIPVSNFPTAVAVNPLE